MSLEAKAENSPGAPVRVLVIQLARLGDTLQSLMALRAAKQMYPDLEIHFVVRDSFAQAADRVSWLHKVIPFPTDHFVNSEVGPAMQGLAVWMRDLVAQRWDFVINWSYSESSSFLAALMPAHVKMGYTRNKDQSISCADGWSHYMQAVLQGGVRQSVHLTDILTTQLLTALQIHLGESSVKENKSSVSKSFFSIKVEPSTLFATQLPSNKKWIAIQLGTSRPEKNLPTEEWIDLIDLISKRNPSYGIVLLGSKKESEIRDQILSEIQVEVIDMVGKTTFDLWATIIAQASWLISPDTSAIHLASILGTRVLNVCLGPAHWSETGPYGTDHLVLQSAVECVTCRTSQTWEAHDCPRRIMAEQIYALWCYGELGGATLKEVFDGLGFGEELPKIDAFKSEIRNVDDGGGVGYRPLVSKPMCLEEWSSHVLSVIARAWYCGWVPQTGTELDRSRIDGVLLQELRRLKNIVREIVSLYKNASDKSAELHDQTLGLKSDTLMSTEDRNKISNIGRDILQMQFSAEKLADSHQALKAFSNMSKVMMHNLRGERLSQISQECVYSYRQLLDGAQLMAEWLDFTLEMVKLRAVEKTVGPRVS